MEVAPGHGFFRENQFGDMVFEYPFSREVTQALSGVPVPLTGRADGLSMLADITPGVGPVTQIPATWFLSNVEELIPSASEQVRLLRQMISPYGQPGTSVGDTFSELVPGWLQKVALGIPDAKLGGAARWLVPPPLRLLPGGAGDAIADAVETGVNTATDVVFGDGLSRLTDSENDLRIYSNSVMDTVAYLYSTGEYQIAGDNPVEEMQRLLADGKEAAGMLWLLRGFGQFTAPTSPAFEFMAETRDGNLVFQSALAEAYRQFQEEDFSTANARFIDTFGVGSIFTVVPKTVTQGSTTVLPATDAAIDYLGDHSFLRDDYQFTFAAFVPPEARDGEFSYDAYLRSLQLGDREALSPEEWQQVGHDLIGRYLMGLHYDQVYADDTQTEEERLITAEYRETLREAFPGFDIDVGPPRPEPSVLVKELERAAADPRLEDHAAMPALRLYLQARLEFFSHAQMTLDVPHTDFFSRTGEDLDEMQFSLLEYGNELANRSPAFETMFDRIFMSEFMVSDQINFREAA